MRIAQGHVSPEFNRSISSQSQEPIPPIECHQHSTKRKVKYNKETQVAPIVSVHVMIPDRHNCDSHPPSTKQHIEDKQQKVAVVLKAQAVVHPRTVVVHLEYTLVTDSTVVCPGWFNIVTPVTSLLPHGPQIIHLFSAVFHHSLHVRAQAFKAVVLSVLVKVNFLPSLS